MAELGIDIHQQYAKAIQVFSDQTFDYIITVCDRARQRQPSLPESRARLHWGYRDPLAITDPEARQRAFRETARQLKTRIRSFLQAVHHIEHQ
jgi:arsenate reductase